MFKLQSGLDSLIDSGELVPGARLNETELCRNMGVSRTPLREAIRSLATEGLVELQPNRGAIVSVVSQDDVTEILPIMASLEGLGGRLLLLCTCKPNKSSRSGKFTIKWLRITKIMN